jgi:ribosome maturation protein SDO1
MLKQPKGIVKLTNVAIVKYRKKNRKAEIACYKNKVIDWRNGNEDNIDNVIQINQIFSNAIQGTIAGEGLLKKLFNTADKTSIIEKILDQGHLQVSQKEREVLAENAFQEVIKILAKKLIHPKSKRLFSEEAIKNALKNINFKADFNTGSKKQAFKAMKKLEKTFNVIRTPVLVEIHKDELELLKENDIEFEIVSEKKYRIGLVVSSKHYNFMMDYSDRLELQVLENNYYNKSTVGIDEEIFVELERRPQVLKEKEEKKEEDNEVKEDSETESEQEEGKKDEFCIIFDFD